MTKKEKFIQFWHKHNMQYLVLAVALYGFTALVYFVCEFLPLTAHDIYMEIDDKIPLISYFQIFYLSYYIVPPLFLWRLSFRDKKKVYTLSIAAVACVIVCLICYLSYQTHMVRPEADAEIAKYEGFNNVHNLDTFLKWTLTIQYASDKKAVNCLPSLHAIFGTFLFCMGVKFFKDEKHFPLYMRIIAIVFGLGMAMATFFIKQHYFIDAVVGMALFLTFYVIAHFVFNHFLKKKNYVFVDNLDNVEKA